MATGLVTNFELLMGLPNFQRDVVETYEKLISVDREGEYAQGHIVYCKETDSYYRYTDVYDKDMGFFKPLSLGIDFVEIESDIEYSDLDFVDTESDLVPEEPEPEPNPEDPNNPEGGEDGGDGTEDGGEDTGGNDGNGENNGEENGEVEEPTEPTEPIT